MVFRGYPIIPKALPILWHFFAFMKERSRFKDIRILKNFVTKLEVLSGALSMGKMPPHVFFGELRSHVVFVNQIQRILLAH